MLKGIAPIKRIAISTGGGDAPGLNAVIRAVVLSALNLGWECYGIRDGFNGLLLPEQFVEGGIIRLTRDKVRGITHLGGTIIGTTNRNNPLAFPITDQNGKIQEIDRTDELVRAFALHRLDQETRDGRGGRAARVTHGRGCLDVELAGVAGYFARQRHEADPSGVDLRGLRDRFWRHWRSASRDHDDRASECCTHETWVVHEALG